MGERRTDDADQESSENESLHDLLLSIKHFPGRSLSGQGKNSLVAHDM